MMLRSAFYSTFLILIATFAAGCVCTDNMCGNGGCSDGACGDADICSTCDGIGCSVCRGRSPVDALKGLVHGGGCGQVYWDEWINDPPYCCDPCDDHNQWVGSRCCPPGITNAWRRLWGYRMHEGNCGCNACIAPHGEFHDGPVYDGQIIEGEVIYEGPAGPGKLGHTNVQKTLGKQVSVLKKNVSSRRPYYQRGK